jgi:pyridoxine kinase
LRTPQLPITVGGTGDVMAALFFAHHLRSGSANQAMSLAASSVFSVLNRTAAASSNEMLLIEAQEELMNPSQIFAGQKI